MRRRTLVRFVRRAGGGPTSTPRGFAVARVAAVALGVGPLSKAAAAYILHEAGRKGDMESAGINRFGVGNERVPRRRRSQPPRPPSTHQLEQDRGPHARSEYGGNRVKPRINVFFLFEAGCPSKDRPRAQAQKIIHRLSPITREPPRPRLFWQVAVAAVVLQREVARNAGFVRVMQAATGVACRGRRGAWKRSYPHEYPYLGVLPLPRAACQRALGPRPVQVTDRSSFSRRRIARIQSRPTPGQEAYAYRAGARAGSAREAGLTPGAKPPPRKGRGLKSPTSATSERSGIWSSMPRAQ